MKHTTPERLNEVRELISQLEVSSQKGTVSLVEETVFLEMIDICEIDGNTASALRLSEQAILQYPFSADFYLRKAQILVELGDIEKSLVTIEHAVIFDPCNVHLRLLQAELLVFKGEYTAALDILSMIKADANRFERADIYCIEAQIFEDMGDYAQMFEAARRILLNDTHNTEGYSKMFWATENTARYREAIDFYNRLLDRNAYNHQAWFNLGFALTAIGNTDDALEAFEFVYAIDEKSKLAYLEAASILIETQEWQKAICTLQIALHQTGADTDIYRKIGICYLEQHDAALALGYFESAISLKNDDAEILYYIGACHAEMKQWRLAQKYLLRATTADSEREEFLALLGDVCVNIGDWKRALQSYRRATIIAPEIGEYWLKYAESQMHNKEYQRAIKILDEAADYAFDLDLAYCRIACLVHLGKKKQALVELNDALSLDYAAHAALAKWIPDFASDTEIQGMIRSFQF